MKTYPPAVFAKRYKKAFDYANPCESVAYSLDPHGHGWDRLVALAGEYARGENNWADTKRMLDDNLLDLIRITGSDLLPNAKASTEVSPKVTN